MCTIVVVCTHLGKLVMYVSFAEMNNSSPSSSRPCVRFKMRNVVVVRWYVLW